MSVSRRGFLTSAVMGSLSLSLRGESGGGSNAQTPPAASKGNVIISAANGFAYLEPAYQMLKNGADTLDVALRVVQGPEDDPNDDTVGLGGLPNEEGVVELDACCMHGPTRRAGAVGGMRNIKNVSRVAQAVMLHTGHVMLVGEGAERFAVAMGFPRENLLTERSRKIWLIWKEVHSSDDWWGPGISDPKFQVPDIGPESQRWDDRMRRLLQLAADYGIEPEFRAQAVRQLLVAPTGTIHCSVSNDKGEVSGCTTTSGLAFKLPGRVGDSPIIGAGCFTDQDVGSAGATGSGEENIKVAGAHTIVENMRRGMDPKDAAMDALKRIARNYNNDTTKLRFVDMTYYVLRKDGAYAGVSLWEYSSPGKPHRFAVHDGTARREQTIFLLKGVAHEFPPMPKVPDDIKKGSEYLN